MDHWEPDWSKEENLLDSICFEERDISCLPKHINIIRSHLLFQIKIDGDNNKLKLKCKLVRHDNKDIEKISVINDSRTAKFCEIRIFPSTLAYFCATRMLHLTSEVPTYELATYQERCT